MHFGVMQTAFPSSSSASVAPFGCVLNAVPTQVLLHVAMRRCCPWDQTHFFCVLHERASLRVKARLLLLTAEILPEVLLGLSNLCRTMSNFEMTDSEQGTAVYRYIFF